MCPLSQPSRREVVVAAGAVTLGFTLTACEWPASDSTTDPQRVADDPDQASLELVSARVRATLDVVTATMAAHPSLRRRLSTIADCHRAHLAALGDDSTAAAPDRPEESASPTEPDPVITGPATAVPPSAPQALSNLNDEEEQLVALLAARSGAAESGALARLCAVMAAGLAPYVTALRDRAPDTSDGAQR